MSKGYFYKHGTYGKRTALNSFNHSKDISQELLWLQADQFRSDMG